MSNLKPLPPTKDGFRYFCCEDDEPLCSEYIKEFNKIEPKKTIPSFLKRKFIPTIVRLSDSDKAPQLKLSDDNLKVTGEKGYSLVRATHGINRGSYYFEATIEEMPDNSAARIGFGQCYSNLQAPLGYDQYGYSWRSRFGTKFHQARGESYDKNGGYSKGDVIGCMIELPHGNKQNITECHHLPGSIKFSGFVIVPKKKDAQPRVIEERDHPPTLESMKSLPGSRISFFKNGQPIGVAFRDIYAGFYYPSVSLYKNCVVSVNFGPRLKYSPKFNTITLDAHQSPLYKPFQDVAEVTVLDNLLADMLHILEKENDPNGKNALWEELKAFRPEQVQ